MYLVDYDVRQDFLTPYSMTNSYVKRLLAGLYIKLHYFGFEGIAFNTEELDDVSSVILYFSFHALCISYTYNMLYLYIFKSQEFDYYLVFELETVNTTAFSMANNIKLIFIYLLL